MEKTIETKENFKTHTRIIKECLLTALMISVVLYIGFIILFNDFETTFLDQVVLFSRILVGSVVVVFIVAGIAQLSKAIGEYIEKRKTEKKSAATVFE
jgi:antibiotic biosynthesis monooxygenase (ABM) superfamily enzyme